MKFLLLIFAFLNISINTCKRNVDKKMSAEKYITLLTTNKYPKYDVIPQLSKADIGILLKQAGNNKLIDNYPIPAISAVNYGPQRVGMIILYTIESIRIQSPYGISNCPYVRDTAAPKRTVSLEELVPLYNTWWANNKDKSAETLKSISPLAGTTFKW